MWNLFSNIQKINVEKYLSITDYKRIPTPIRSRNFVDIYYKHFLDKHTISLTDFIFFMKTLPAVIILMIQV